MFERPLSHPAVLDEGRHLPLFVFVGGQHFQVRSANFDVHQKLGTFPEGRTVSWLQSSVFCPSKLGSILLRGGSLSWSLGPPWRTVHAPCRRSQMSVRRVLATAQPGARRHEATLLDRLFP